MPPRAYLVDLGLAQDLAAASRLTRTGEALGTVAYMSPEQARGELAALSPASDVWSLAAVAYELLAGRPAFEGSTAAAVLAAVLAGRPVPLRRLRADVPAPLDALLGNAFAATPALRPANGARLREGLADVLAGGTGAHQARRRRRTAVTTVGAAVAIGVGIWALRPAAEPPAPVESNADAAAAERAWGTRLVDPRGSAAALERLADGTPPRTAWRVRAALCWLMADEPDRARAAIAAVPASAPEFRDAALLRAFTAMLWHDQPIGRADLDAAAAGADRTAGIARAALALREGQWTEARTRLADLDGWDAALLRAYTEETDPAGDPDAAVADYTRALAEGIGRGWMHNNRGLAHQRGGELAAALRDFDTAVALVPGSVVPLINRATLHHRMGDLAAADADLSNALDRAPDRPDLWTARARARLAQDRHADALADADRAVALAPDGAVGHRVRGAALAALGRPSEALSVLDRAAALDPTDDDVAHTRGLARAQLGDHLEAIAEFDRALALKPGRHDTLSARAGARWEAGDPEAAVADYRAALALRADYLPAAGNLGLVLAQLGRDTEAADALRRFLARAPDHPGAAQVRARLTECEARLAERR